MARSTHDSIFNYALMEGSVNAHFGKWATREKMLWVGPRVWATAEALMHMITQNGLWVLNHHSRWFYCIYKSSRDFEISLKTKKSESIGNLLSCHVP